MNFRHMNIIISIVSFYYQVYGIPPGLLFALTYWIKAKFKTRFLKCGSRLNKEKTRNKKNLTIAVHSYLLRWSCFFSYQTLRLIILFLSFIFVTRFTIYIMVWNLFWRNIIISCLFTQYSWHRLRNRFLKC